MATTVRISKVPLTQPIFFAHLLLQVSENPELFKEPSCKIMKFSASRKKGIAKNMDYKQKIEVEHHMTSFEMNYNPSKLNQENMHVNNLNGTFHSEYHLVRVQGITKFSIFVYLKLKNFFHHPSAIPD